MMGVNMIEKDFLENFDYLMDLSERVKKSKRISPKLLSEIKFAKDYIDSISSSFKSNKYNLIDISNMFGIIISDSNEIKHRNFENPCLVDSKKKESVIDFIIDKVWMIVDFVEPILDSPIIFVLVPIVLFAALLLTFGRF